MSQQRTLKIGLSNADKTNMATDIRKLVVAQLFATYSSSTTYDIGDFCQYDGTIYKCIVAITTAEAWNSDHWAVAKLNEVIDAINEAVASVDSKANVDGNYPTMTVGQAESIASDRIIDDIEDACPPIVFGTTGGDAEITSGFSRFKELYGKSLVVNQWQVDSKNLSNAGITGTLLNGISTFSGTSTTTSLWTKSLTTSADFKGIANHKYLVILEVLKNTNNTSSFSFYIYNGSSVVQATNAIKTGNKNLILTFQNDFTSIDLGFQTLDGNGTVVDSKIRSMIVDLTQMFGAGNEPTTVAEFKAMFPQDYIAYNTGTIVSTKPYQLVSRMRNQWDEEWELGIITLNTGTSSDGQNASSTTQIRGKNYYRVIAGQTYFLTYPVGTAMAVAYYDADKNFLGYSRSNDYGGVGTANTSPNSTLTIPSGVSYIRFYMGSSYGTTYNNDICIYIEWDTPNLPYVAYKQQVVNLPNIELRSAGNVRDTLTSTGKLIRKTYEIDLGDLIYWENYTQVPSVWYNYLNNTDADKIPNKDWTNANVNITCSKYTTYKKVLPLGTDDLPNMPQMSISRSGTVARIIIKDPSLEGKTANEVRAALTGVKVIYEILTPYETQEEVSWTELVEVDNYGTLEFLTSPQQAVQIPQPYYIEYTVNLVEFLDTAYVHTGGDANNIALIKGEGESLEETDPTTIAGLKTYGDALDAQLKNALGGTLRQLLVTNVVAGGGTLDFLNTDVVDLGTLDWTYGEQSGGYRFTTGDISALFKHPADSVTLGNGLCSLYKMSITYTASRGEQDKIIALGINGNLYVVDSAYTDATTFKNAMKGVLLAFEKASE